MQRTIDFYTALCTDLMLTVDDDGGLYIVTGDSDTPATVNDGAQHLVLPTREQLDKKEDWAKRMAFHPLAESISRQESLVMRNVRRLMTVTIGVRASVLLNAIGKALLDQGETKTLKPAQGKILKNVTNYKKTTHQTLNKVLRSMDVEELDRRMINFFIKKGGKVDGVGYSRACIVTFPLLEALAEDNLDIKYRNKTDQHQILELVEAVLPGWSSERYNSGTNSNTATSLTALLTSFYQVAYHLNKLIKTFSNLLPEWEDLQFDLAWWDMVEDIPDFIDEIPTLDGNAGLTKEREKAVKEGKTTMKDETSRSNWSDLFDPRARTGFSLQTPGGFGSPPPATTGWGSPAINTNTQAPQSPWGTSANTGYVSRAQRVMGKAQRQVGFQEDLPPWVESAQQPSRGWGRGPSF